MAGKRLVDAAKLFNAARSIAKQHIALRTHQFDIYSKTSTLVKAVKSQTDRVTVTAEAAHSLAKRLNENGSNQVTAFASQSQSVAKDDSIPRRDSVVGQGSKERTRQGLEQDHHYERREGNSTAEPLPQKQLDVKQEKPSRYPLPDGSIPPTKARLDESPSDTGKDTFNDRGTPETPKEPTTTEATALHPIESGSSTIPIPKSSETDTTTDLGPEDARKMQRQAEAQIPSVASDSQPGSVQARAQDVFHGRSETASPEYSSLPRMKIPKNTENTQMSDEHVKDGQINQDVYYSSGRPQSEEQIPRQEAEPVQEVPEGINMDVFHSPKVSKMLGGQKSRDGQVGLGMKAATKTPIEKSKLSEGKDQETFNIRTSSGEEPYQAQSFESEAPELAVQHPDEDVKDLASALSSDMASSDAIPEVW